MSTHKTAMTDEFFEAHKHKAEHTPERLTQEPLRYTDYHVGIMNWLAGEVIKAREDGDPLVPGHIEIMARAHDRIAELLEIAEATAEHFSYTDAPLGDAARIAIRKARGEG